MRETIREKALRAIAEDRVRVVKANAYGIAIDVVGTRADPETGLLPTYRTVVCVEGRRIVRECDCPAFRRCNHLEVAELLWKPRRPRSGER